jgi:hypothetical protein
MAFAQNGAAIIGAVVVPASEVKVLRALVELNRPATVPEIATHMKDEMSDASLYSLLSRLEGKRRLVYRQVVEVELHGTRIRRVTWSPTREATSFFLKEYQIDSKAQQERVPVSG